jgi:hypothetical protein
MTDSYSIVVGVYTAINHCFNKILDIPVTTPSMLDHIDVSFINENKFTVNFISFEEKEYYHQSKDIFFTDEQKSTIVNAIVKRMLCGTTTQS